MTRARLEPIALLPRGLSADEAARYVGLGRTKFEELVRAGKMPRGKTLGGRVIYDRLALDMAFSDLEDERGNSIDALLQSG